MYTHWYFDVFVKPFLKRKIILTDLELSKIRNFVDALVDVKMTQTRFLKQQRSLVIHSFNNSYMSEVAIENVIETPFIHWKIRPEKELDMSDLHFLGLDIGVKTAEYGNLPLVYRSDGKRWGCKDPEIMTIIEKPNIVYIAGYATKHMVNYYQKVEYSFGPVSESKAGFWGFHKLYDFNSINDLRKLYNDSNINNFNNFTDTTKEYLPAVDEVDIEF
jgi:hypothetical protein